MARKQNSSVRRRVAVTGIGVIAANGFGIDEFSRNLFAGVQGVRPVESDGLPPGYIGAPISKSLPDRDGSHKETDRAGLLALLSAEEAMCRSRLGRDPGILARSATTFGTMAGELDSYFRYLRKVSGESEASKCVYPALLRTSPGTIAACLARHFQLSGGVLTAITACTAGANAIALGLDMIRLDRADVVLACAADSFSEVSLSGFDSLKSLTKTACKPFDKQRDGLLLGEGSGAVVLEEWQHAINRQATIYAEVTGYGLSNDAFHPTQPDPEAGGACRAIKRALADSGFVPEQMDYINAHGTSTKYNDLVELNAIRKVYGKQGKYRLPISSSKSMAGHTLGAAGMIGAIATIMALHHRFLPPTANFENPMDDCGYDFLPAGRPAERANVMSSHSFAFAGNAACLVFCRGSEKNESVRAVADTTF